MLNVIYDALYTLPYIAVLYTLAGLAYEYEKPHLLAFSYVLVLLVFAIMRIQKKWKFILLVPFAGLIIIEKPSIELLITLAIGAVAFGLGYLGKKILPLQLALAGGVICFFVYEMVNNDSPSVYAVVNGFFIVGFALFVLIDKYWKRIGSTGKKKYFVSIAPFMLITILAVIVLPKPDKPYDWAIFIRIYNQIKYSIDTAMNSVTYEEGSLMSGFSENSRMSGEVVPESHAMMNISTTQILGESFYLTGKIFDSFDGINWNQTSHSSANDFALDTIETLTAIRNFDDEKYYDLAHRNKISVKFTYGKSNYCFVPLKSLPFNETMSQSKAYQADDCILFEKTGDKKTKYSVDFYEFNYNSNLTEPFLDSTPNYGEEEWIETMNSLFMGHKNENISYSDYLKHKKHIYKDYTYVGDFSPEMEEYMSSLMAGATTNSEKLNRIVSDLKSMDYTLTPGEYPDSIKTDSQFLDYFILEKREGYCCYFATAFVLMARHEGFPARYVHGYYVNQTNTNTVVKSDMAHAWPEVYIDGIGWIAYEPTPGYRRTAVWAKDSVTAKSEEPEHGYGGLDRETSDIDADNADDLGVLDDTEKSNTPGFITPIKVIISIVVVLLLLIIILLADAIIARHHFKKFSDEQKIIVLIKKSLAMLKLCGFNYENTETVNEFIMRLLASEKFSSQDLMILIIMNQISYSDCHKASIDDVSASYDVLSAKIRDILPKRKLIRLLVIEKL